MSTTLAMAFTVLFNVGLPLGASALAYGNAYGVYGPISPPGYHSANHTVLDVYLGRTDNFTPVQMYTPNGTDAQGWRLGPGFIQGVSGKVLTMLNTMLMLDYLGREDQQWGFSNFIMQAYSPWAASPSSLCVQPSFSQPWAGGYLVRLSECGGSATQYFTYTASGRLRTSGKICLEAANLGQVLLAKPCSVFSSGQVWSINGVGQICNNVGCIYNAGTFNYLDESLTLQSWGGYDWRNGYRLEGEIRNAPSGMCLEWPWNAGDWTRVVVNPCNGSFNQQWRYSGDLSR